MNDLHLFDLKKNIDTVLKGDGVSHLSLNLKNEGMASTQNKN